MGSAPVKGPLPAGSFGDLAAAEEERLRLDRALERLERRDASLWTGTSESGLLGWLDLPARSAELLPAIRALCAAARAEGVDRVVVLGMGGSSLGAEALVRCARRAEEGSPELVLLDSTDPDRIATVEAELRGHRPLFLAASKSGTTLETALLQRYFLPRFTARSFVAVTDPGTPLEAEAGGLGFRAVFHGEPDVGGRFSVLSVFGLLPAALCGVAVDEVLQSASRARAEIFSGGARSRRIERIAGFVAAAATSGRDKLGVLAAPRLAPFGWWWEQLVAESLGKDGRGVVPVLDPVLGHAIGASAWAGHDRAFLWLQDEDDDPRSSERAPRSSDAGAGPGDMARLVDAMRGRGGEVLAHRFAGEADFGGELYDWEVATALVGHLLAMNPFDQPDVESAKVVTRRYVERLRRGEGLPKAAAARVGALELSAQADAARGTVGDDSDALAAVLGAAASPGSYVALLAYLPDRPEIALELGSLRELLAERLHAAVCSGYGPRYLHSTGQLHKGGPPSGCFVVLTAERAASPPISAERFGFREVQLAQALGDAEALAQRGRPVVRVHLHGDIPAALVELRGLLEARLGS